MQVEVLRACDIWLSGHPVAGRKALFPGQRYELPDWAADLVADLESRGSLRVIGGATAAATEHAEESANAGDEATPVTPQGRPRRGRRG